MSRIGKKKITIPEGVTVTIGEDVFESKGPKGTNIVKIPKGFFIKQEQNMLVIVPKSDSEASSLFGLCRTLIANAVEGSEKGFEKQLEIKGVGYRAKMEGSCLVLTVGFSHPVKIEQPNNISFAVKGSTIIVAGNDKQQVGETAAKLRSIRPPDAYKGKGIRYKGEVVRLKPGKAVKTTTGA